MIPGPDRFIHCPHCEALSRVPTLISGNTIGASYWTDGFMLAAMLPQTPPITCCHSCHGIFWVAGAEEAFVTPPKSVAATIPCVEDLREEKCLDALDAGLATSKEQERQLRTLAWWRANDGYRERIPKVREGSPIPRSARQRENLRRLDALLDGADPEDAFAKAELARENADFERALGILDRLGKNPETESWAPRVRREQLTALCRSRLSHLTRFDFETVRQRERKEKLVRVLRRFLGEYCEDDPTARLSTFDFAISLEAWARERGSDEVGHWAPHDSRLEEALRDLGYASDGDTLKGLRCTYTNQGIDDWRNAWADWSRRREDRRE